jgi:hypothetical protein
MTSPGIKVMNWLTQAHQFGHIEDHGFGVAGLHAERR